jgi:REP element-mobilizing transposase RayT
MARPLRIEYAGAVYHVMARGNQGEKIFADDLDRKRWLETLGEAVEKTGWMVHAYVLMGNHYHLLLETPEANLVVGMKWLQSTYTLRYNSRHEVFGHLFQGRYKALVVDGAAGNYFGVVSTYIHLNPARAKLIKIGKEPLSRYRWSSYPWYLKSRRQRPAWLRTERVMGDVGIKPQEVAGYEAFMEARVLELGMKAGRRELNEAWKAIRRGWYLGGEGFRGRLKQHLKQAMDGGMATSYGGEAKREHGEGEAERMLAQGMKALVVTKADLARGSKSMVEKQVLAWWLRQRTAVGRRWLSQRLWMGEESGVTRAVRNVKGTADVELKRAKQQLLKGLPE